MISSPWGEGKWRVESGEGLVCLIVATIAHAIN